MPTTDRSKYSSFGGGWGGDDERDERKRVLPTRARLGKA
jgi:hypothetical protein